MGVYFDKPLNQVRFE